MSVCMSVCVDIHYTKSTYIYIYALYRIVDNFG